MTNLDRLIDKVEARYSKYRDGRDVYALIATVREQAGRIAELEAENKRLRDRVDGYMGDLSQPWGGMQ